MNRLRIIKRTNLDGSVEFVIQKRILFWWVDASGLSYARDTFGTPEAAQANLKWYDGSKPTEEVVYTTESRP